MHILKKTIKYFLITLLVLFIALCAAPFIFHKKIKAVVLETIDKHINATVNFEDIRFNSIKNFPHLTITIDSICVVGINDFKKDTLISAKEIDIAIDMMRMIKGQDIEIKSIRLQQPKIYALILKNGEANYNIIKPDTSHTQNAGDSKLELSI